MYVCVFVYVYIYAMYVRIHTRTCTQTQQLRLVSAYLTTYDTHTLTGLERPKEGQKN